VAPWQLEPSVVAAGAVSTEDDIARTFLAAARGASLMITISSDVPSPARAELLDALARIAPIERLVVEQPDETDDTMRDALRVLASGGSVSEAAAKVHMSERTLHRRLAELRAQLGVRSNTAAARRVLSAD
jgi:DNA-binding NarL/FixJ family response regulator